MHGDGGVEGSFDAEVHDVGVLETDPIGETHSGGKSLGRLDVGRGDVDAHHGGGGLFGDAAGRATESRPDIDHGVAG